MATMRAVDVKGGKGPVSSLFVNGNVSKPTPAGNQALVKIKAFGLNRMDLFQREGKYPVPPHASKTMGVEFSGIIEGFGNEPERHFKVGDRVFGLAYGGAYAEWIAVSTHMLIHMPKQLSWEEAAGIPETWITATQALYIVGRYQPGMSVLWHAGASNVSIAGIQLAKSDGASSIYVTASSREKIDFCKSLGATEGFSYRDSDWAQALLSYTNGEGVDLIVDFVGASYFDQNLEAATRDGCVVNLANLGGSVLQGPIDISRLLRKRLRYEGSGLRSRDEAYQGRLRDMLVEHALPKFVDGSFKVVIQRIFKMNEIQEAHSVMESNQTMGKFVCTVD